MWFIWEAVELRYWWKHGNVENKDILVERHSENFLLFPWDLKVPIGGYIHSYWRLRLNNNIKNIRCYYDIVLVWYLNLTEYFREKSVAFSNIKWSKILNSTAKENVTVP